ncbi:hypothetical protein PPGU19_084790 (plasmid) [Paraburkholderia sp. PGU19]|uniref:hypothetical protein n=1 Tax=Paraburkholderia sp. PGU19 TaxID=2735434 RepID=UPI0015D99A00|nr:hypothetical protein [Paraburkholderia sp. PGU19]BCG03911.1 hypothetical protein PPGU19_084790 [Paraburkholderia sp. PGU19]
MSARVTFQRLLCILRGAVLMALLLAGGFVLTAVQEALARAPATNHTVHHKSHEPMGRNAAAPQQASAPSQADMLARERLDFDKAKTAFDQSIENQKMELERKKLANDNARIDLDESKNWWAAASTIVPLLGVLATLAFSIYSFRKQQAMQIESQNETARLNFEIKAAEIAFEGKSAYAVENRGRALRQIFSDRLRTDFLTNFNPDEFGGDAEPATQKMTLLDLLAKYPNQRTEILTNWSNLFPGDRSWLARVPGAPPRSAPPQGPAAQGSGTGAPQGPGAQP